MILMIHSHRGNDILPTVNKVGKHIMIINYKLIVLQKYRTTKPILQDILCLLYDYSVIYDQQRKYQLRVEIRAYDTTKP